MHLEYHLAIFAFVVFISSPDSQFSAVGYSAHYFAQKIRNLVVTHFLFVLAFYFWSLFLSLAASLRYLYCYRLRQHSRR